MKAVSTKVRNVAHRRKMKSQDPSDNDSQRQQANKKMRLSLDYACGTQLLSDEVLDHHLVAMTLEMSKSADRRDLPNLRILLKVISIAFCKHKLRLQP